MKILDIPPFGDASVCSPFLATVDRALAGAFIAHSRMPTLVANLGERSSSGRLGTVLGTPIRTWREIDLRIISSRPGRTEAPPSG